MTNDDNPEADAAQAAADTESSEPPTLDANETVEAVVESLEPQSPIENLKSNTPMPGDSLLTKVIKVITNWT